MFFTNLISSPVLERVTDYILIIFTSTAVMTTLVKEKWPFFIYGVYLPHQFRMVELKSKQKKRKKSFVYHAPL